MTLEYTTKPGECYVCRKKMKKEFAKVNGALVCSKKCCLEIRKAFDAMCGVKGPITIDPKPIVQECFVCKTKGTRMYTTVDPVPVCSKKCKKIRAAARWLKDSDLDSNDDDYLHDKGRDFLEYLQVI